MIAFSKNDLRRIIPTAAYRLGMNYWLERRVKQVSYERQDNGDLLIHASVKGSGHAVYQQNIRLHGRRSASDFSFDASCTCPVGYHCKHVAAVLMEVLENGIPALDQQASATTVPSHALRSPAPPPSKPKPSVNAAPAAESGLDFGIRQWLLRVQEACDTGEPDAYPEQLRQRLLYILHPQTQNNGYKKLQVELVSTRLLKNGGYSITHPFKDTQAAYIRPLDKVLLKWLTHLQEATTAQRQSYDLHGAEAVEVLQRLLSTERCHWLHKNNPPLRLGTARQATAHWRVEQDGRQRLSYRVAGGACEVLGLSPPWYVDLETAECGPLDTGLPATLAEVLLEAPVLLPEQAMQVRKALEKQAARLPEQLPKPQPLGQQCFEQHPLQCEIYLYNQIFETEYAHRWRYTSVPPLSNAPFQPSQPQEAQVFPLLRLSFRYAQAVLNAYSQAPEILNFYDTDRQLLVQVQRDFAEEQHAKQRLRELRFVPLADHALAGHFKLPEECRADLVIAAGEHPTDMASEQALLDFSLHQVPKLRGEGWKVEMAADYLFQTLDPLLLEDWYAEIEESSGIDWFGLELGVYINGEKINLLPLLVDLLRNLSDGSELQRLTELPDGTLLTPRLEDGRILPLPVGRVRDILHVLIELLGAEPLDEAGRLRLLTLRAAQLVELETAMNVARTRWMGGERLLELGRKLKNLKGIKEIALPADFQTELRPYQQEGLNWLQFLREFKLAGILADDMGLGKTVQTLAHLLTEKHAGRLDKPALVIAPTSLMVNWKRESQRFAPALRVLTLHGPERKQHFEALEHYDLILTTYPLLPRDREALMAHTYSLLILDEAQNIKNPKAKVTQLVHQLHADHRLCLTGTPMENHLGELWSLFHFLMPGLLGDNQSFRNLFRGPIERDGDPLRRDILAKRIAPFMLRRTKEEVVKELPEKNEIVRSVELDGAQRDLYETIRLTMHNKIRREIAQKGIGRSQIVILDALLKLRQICCDPRLLKLETAHQVKQSAKLDLLMDILPEMLEEGRRVLLFSQFTSMLSLIEIECKKHKLDYLKLTGRTKNRGEIVEQFQDGQVPLFLISLKAGGTGLNLTAADTVIHYDPWWNPAVENQATDRAHRIGQDKKVFVYKLLTEGTVEEKIQELQAHKQKLADALLGEGSGATGLSTTDLESLFEPLN